MLHAVELHEDSNFAYKIKTWFGLDFKLEAIQTTLEQTDAIPYLEKFLSVGNSPNSALWDTFELDVVIFMRWPYKICYNFAVEILDMQIFYEALFKSLSKRGF